MIDFETRRERFYNFFQSLSEDVKMSVVWGLVILGLLSIIMTTIIMYNVVDDPGPPKTVEEIVCADAAFKEEPGLMDLCRDLHQENGERR